MLVMFHDGSFVFHLVFGAVCVGVFAFVVIHILQYCIDILRQDDCDGVDDEDSCIESESFKLIPGPLSKGDLVYDLERDKVVVFCGFHGYEDMEPYAVVSYNGCEYVRPMLQLIKVQAE